VGNLVYQRWVELGNELITKYNDGYIKESRHIKAVPYPKAWREEIIRQNPEKHKIIKW